MKNLIHSYENGTNYDAYFDRSNKVAPLFNNDILYNTFIDSFSPPTHNFRGPIRLFRGDRCRVKGVSTTLITIPDRTYAI
jgi:hypothetical protein